MQNIHNIQQINLEDTRSPLNQLKSNDILLIKRNRKIMKQGLTKTNQYYNTSDKRQWQQQQVRLQENQENHSKKKGISLYNIKSIQSFIFGKVDSLSKKKFIYNLYRGIHYSMRKLKHPPINFIQKQSIFLNEQTISNKKFLMLDLDETLVHTHRFMNTEDENNKFTYKISFRPHLFNFLERMSLHYDIYVFTAAQKCYAQAAVAKINRKKCYIKDFLCRQNCFETKRGFYLKDLRIIENRPLSDIVIIDNLVESFGLQLNNGIPILDFINSPQDTQLLHLIPFLQDLSKVKDVRQVLKQRYKLQNIGSISKSQMAKYFQDFD